MDAEQGVIAVWKRLGETPLDAVRRLASERPELPRTMTYAGRLDPLAEGVLLVLAGEARHRKNDFLKLDKEYEFDVLWGFETDSYDVLGSAARTGRLPEGVDVGEAASRLVGTFEQPYPPYSSKPVSGRPLFMLAREGRLAEIAVPSKKVTVHELSAVGERRIAKRDLAGEVERRIGLVAGDFRQAEALASWRKALSG